MEWDWTRVVFDHVHIRVRDARASVAFHRATLAPLGIPRSGKARTARSSRTSWSPRASPTRAGRCTSRSSPTRGSRSRHSYASSKSFLVTFTQLLAIELRETGVRVQVVCPGVVHTEFHSRQGVDLSAVPRMDPAAVVRASLLDLERGVVVSIPGAPDESSFQTFVAAGAGLQDLTRTVELPDRYVEP